MTLCVCTEPNGQYLQSSVLLAHLGETSFQLIFQDSPLQSFLFEQVALQNCDHWIVFGAIRTDFSKWYTKVSHIIAVNDSPFNFQFEFQVNDPELTGTRVREAIHSA